MEKPSNFPSGDLARGISLLPGITECALDHFGQVLDDPVDVVLDVVGNMATVHHPMLKNSDRLGFRAASSCQPDGDSFGRPPSCSIRFDPNRIQSLDKIRGSLEQAPVVVTLKQPLDCVFRDASSSVLLFLMQKRLSGPYPVCQGDWPALLLDVHFDVCALGSEQG